MIFTFWEGNMPAYIKLCLDTWKQDYIMLNYDNLNQYTDLKVDDRLKSFTLPQIADCVRVHVLRDNGGYWLDTDTIMITDKLPTENMIGDIRRRTNTIGYLHTEAHSEMFEKWAEYQDYMIATADSKDWSIMGNRFTDGYIRNHHNITIADVTPCWPETQRIRCGWSRYNKYQHLYFGTSLMLSDLPKTDMLMLHNSWTPSWYKNLSRDDVLADKCTLSNILREVSLCGI